MYATGVTGQPGYWVAAGPEYESSTVGTGAYELRVPVGTYVLRFDPSCGRTLPSPYAVQYYLGQVDLERADAISVSATSPATGINALLATGFSLSGAVTGSEAPNGLANVCVSAVDAATATVGRATTSTNGTFTIANLPAGSYWVHFDPTCGGARKSHYAAQYYPGQAWPTTTAELAVGADVTGVDAQLVNGASLSGTVTAAGAANNAGICVAAVGAGGDVTGLGITSQTGWYEITNLAAGNYRVTIDPTCNGSQASYFSAEDYGHTISVAAGHAYSGINVTVALQYGPPLSITLASLPAGKVYSSYFADPVDGRAQHRGERLCVACDRLAARPLPELVVAVRGNCGPPPNSRPFRGDNNCKYGRCGASPCCQPDVPFGRRARLPQRLGQLVVRQTLGPPRARGTGVP